MVYKVVVSGRAERDLASILHADSGRYTPQERLDYVEEIEARCFKLDMFPKRSTPIVINDFSYFRLTHKGHAVYYRVIEAENSVLIVTVLHGRMEFEEKL